MCVPQIIGSVSSKTLQQLNSSIRLAENNWLPRVNNQTLWNNHAAKLPDETWWAGVPSGVLFTRYLLLAAHLSIISYFVSFKKYRTVHSVSQGKIWGCHSVPQGHRYRSSHSSPKGMDKVGSLPW